MQRAKQTHKELRASPLRSLCERERERERREREKERERDGKEGI